jgi:hypothetical protein
MNMIQIKKSLGRGVRIERERRKLEGITPPLQWEERVLQAIKLLSPQDLPAESTAMLSPYKYIG